MLRHISLGAIMVLLATTLSAQNLDSYISKLGEPDFRGGRVLVYGDSDAQSALRRIASLPRSEKFLGYRIGIYFDNSPSARGNAQAVLTKFKSHFPGVESFMIYENPYFKVSAGSCATQEEAVMLLNRVQAYFPDAYLMREQMSVNDVAKSTIPSASIVDPEPEPDPESVLEEE